LLKKSRQLTLKITAPAACQHLSWGMGVQNSCLIVGAGMAGLSAAAVLRDAGWHVQLLDKGRGVGGRMATRRIGGSRFDHGAQFFTVRDESFHAAIENWKSSGWVVPWFTDEGHTRYRGIHGMNGLAKELAVGLDIHTETTVATILPDPEGWRILVHTGQEFLANTVIVTCPVPQSLALVGDAAPKELTNLAYDPCFALMAVLDGPSLVPAPGYVRPESGPLSFLADNARKGISEGPGALTVHASAEFSRHWFDGNREEITRVLLDAAIPWLGSRVTSTQLHRWKFSHPVNPYPDPCFMTNAPSPLVFAGDSFGSPRVEGAWLSGLASAKALISIV
jgi:renalase